MVVLGQLNGMPGYTQSGGRHRALAPKQPPTPRPPTRLHSTERGYSTRATSKGGRGAQAVGGSPPLGSPPILPLLLVWCY